MENPDIPEEKEEVNRWDGGNVEEKGEKGKQEGINEEEPTKHGEGTEKSIGGGGGCSENPDNPEGNEEVKRWEGGSVEEGIPDPQGIGSPDGWMKEKMEELEEIEAWGEGWERAGVGSRRLGRERGRKRALS